MRTLGGTCNIEVVATAAVRSATDPLIEHRLSQGSSHVDYAVVRLPPVPCASSAWSETAKRELAGTGGVLDRRRSARTHVWSLKMKAIVGSGLLKRPQVSVRARRQLRTWTQRLSRRVGSRIG